MLEIPKIKIPMQEIEYKGTKIFIKREDLIHPQISGNKYWKLFYNINDYLRDRPGSPKIVTFGGAYSNHIGSVAAFGKLMRIPTIGIIRGEEIKWKKEHNPTLKQAMNNGMELIFVSREEYKNKMVLTSRFKAEFPNALLIPEGGTNELGVKGLRYMLTPETKDFFYLCAAVGTGGTLAGICRYAAPQQQPLGFMVVKDPGLKEKIEAFAGRRDFKLIDAAYGGYGKISDQTVEFINDFYRQYHILLDPVYTGKMMKKIFELIDNGFFNPERKILAFHTGGLQGIEGANQMLRSKNRSTITFLE